MTEEIKQRFPDAPKEMKVRFPDAPKELKMRFPETTPLPATGFEVEFS